MTFKNILILCILFSTFCLSAQSKDSVLFTINNKEVYTSEFNRVYKKNAQILTEENKSSVANYLDLFVNYKLKVEQAKDFGLDTISSYLNELATYKKQLIEPYLKDDNMVDSLVKEAYQRSLYEVNASHILVKADINNPKDTIKAFLKITEAQNKILNGASFEEIAKAYSDDPSVNRNEGKLGYFTVFDMVYSFENAVYNSEIGGVSNPFKTKYGFHIVKVNNKRETFGEIEVAHIMIKGDSAINETKIYEIYKQLKSGEDFGYLAKTQSDDKFSAKKNGNLGRFRSGKMVKEFEDVAFSMKDSGDISEPFKTQYGWHIVMLVQKFPMKSYEESVEELTSKVKRGDRSELINNSIVNDLKKKYKISIDQEALNEFSNVNWKENSEELTKELLFIEGEVIGQEKLFKYLNNRELTNDLFDSFVNFEIVEYYKNHLEETNADFAHIYKEYKEGLLLFELLQTRIWEKSKDSSGIQNYYNNHKRKYVLNKRFKGLIATCDNKKTAKIVRKKFENDESLKSIKESVNSGDDINVIFKLETFEKGDELVPSEYEFKEGVSNIYESQEKFIVINNYSILESEQQELSDIRGTVIGDYQELLEKEWVVELHATYNVELNQEAVKLLSDIE